MENKLNNNIQSMITNNGDGTYYIRVPPSEDSRGMYMFVNQAGMDQLNEAIRKLIEDETKPIKENINPIEEK